MNIAPVKSFAKSVSRMLAVLLASTTLLAVPAQAAPCLLSAPGEDGNQQTPFRIASEADFLNIPTCDGPGVHFQVDNNITFTTRLVPFDLQGHLNGNTMTFQDLVVDTSSDVDRDRAGLFRELLPGSSVDSLTLNAPEVSGRNQVGALAGRADGATITDVTVSNAVVTADGDFAGGLIGSAVNTELSEIFVVGGGVSGENYLGGLAGSYVAGGVQQLEKLHTAVFVRSTAVQSAGDPVFVGGLFGRLEQDASFAISEAVVYSEMVASLLTAEGYFGGILGEHVSTSTDLANPITLGLGRVLVQHVPYDSAIDSRNGLLLGRSEVVNPGAGLEIVVDQVFAVAQSAYNANTSTAAVGELADPEISVPDPDHFILTQSTNDYVVTVNQSYGYTTANYSEAAWPQTHISRGWSIATGETLPTFIAQQQTPDWFIMQAAEISYPMPYWFVDKLTDVDLTRAPLGQPGSALQSFTAQGTSWVDVPVADRVYLDPFVEYDPQNDWDDLQMVYVPAGISCSNGFQRVAADHYPNGYFIFEYFTDSADYSYHLCERDGQLVQFGSSEELGGGFDLGFELKIGEKRITKLFPTTNGNLNFESQKDSFSRSAFAAANFGQSGLLGPVINDQVFETDTSSFWAARTTIDGKKAAVFSFENFSPYPLDNSRAQAGNYSYQAVLVQQAPGEVEVWYNYEDLSNLGSLSSAPPLFELIVDLESGVTPGSNVVTANPEFSLPQGCFFFYFVDDVSYIPGQVTDPVVSARLAGSQSVYVRLLSLQDRTVELYTDSLCTSPFTIQSVQDVAQDGEAILLLEGYGSNGVTPPKKVFIGYSSYPTDSSQEFVYQHYFQNIDAAELANGGAQELISASIGTTVLGRIVSSFSFTPTPVQSSGPVYSGPIIQSTSVSAQAGETVVLTGSNLSSVTAVEIAGVELAAEATATSITFTLPVDSELGLQDVVIISSFGRLTIPGLLNVSAPAAAESNETLASIKRTGNSARVFVGNVIGAGKVQIKVNGKEIAWVRAVDETDPKLREAGGNYYLVRTFDLEEGKNAIEIYVEGERIRRVAYTKR